MKSLLSEFLDLMNARINSLEGRIKELESAIAVQTGAKDAAVAEARNGKQQTTVSGLFYPPKSTDQRCSFKFKLFPIFQLLPNKGYCAFYGYLQ